MKRLSLTLIALALVAAACNSSGGGSTSDAPQSTTRPPTSPTSGGLDTTAGPGEEPGPTFTETDCRFDEPPGVEVECGDLVVPQNRQDPEGGDVTIHVAEFASPNPNKEPDPIIYLVGGPGGHVLETLQLSFTTQFAPLLENRDLILFDQRGAGLSEPSLACPEVRDVEIELLDDPLTEAEAGELESAALRACRDRLVGEGVDLAAYNSAANAADVADLRVALGYDEVNLWGISYGTRLALTTMRDHPEGIRSVVLDSTVPPQLDLIAGVPFSADRSFDTFFASCAADARCAEAYGDVEQTFLDLEVALEASPAEITLENFVTEESYPAVITGDRLYGLLFQSLYAEDIIILLPDIFTDALAGDYGGLERLASVMFTNDDFFTLGMYLSVQCNEEYPFSTVDDVEAALADHPDVAALFGYTEGEFADCEMWGAGTADPIEEAPVASDIPTLVMAGEFDPITPPSYGRTAAETLSSSFFFEFPGLAHGVSTASECSTSVLLSFVDDPRSEPDAACIAAMSGPVYFVAGDVSVTLVDFEADFFGTLLTGVRPDGWTDQGFGAFSAPGFGDVGIVQQAVPAGFSTPEAIANLYQSQLGLTESWTESSFDDGARTWSVYRSTDDDLIYDLGITEDGDNLIAILLITPPDVSDTYVATVFEPAMEAATAR